MRRREAAAVIARKRADRPKLATPWNESRGARPFLEALSGGPGPEIPCALPSAGLSWSAQIEKFEDLTLEKEEGEMDLKSDGAGSRVGGFRLGDFYTPTAAGRRLTMAVTELLGNSAANNCSSLTEYCPGNPS